MKKTSLNDIAKSLGVSKTLVSMVLNGHGTKNGISKQTQEKVHAKARELNYKPNQIARGLRTGKSNTIGLIVADISNPFYAKLARHIEHYCSLANYNVIFCSSEEEPHKEAELLDMLADRQVDGIILSATGQDSNQILKLKRDGIPFVLIDRYYPRLDNNFVGVDNYQSAYDLTDHLIRLGYNRIAHLTVSPSHASSLRDRYKGYRAALKDANIRYSSQYYQEVSFEEPEAGVTRAIRELLEPPHIVNAIFAANNRLAVTALEVFNKWNIKIPQDVALVSFDDMDLFKFCFPPITAVAQPIQEIGKHAVELLIHHIENKEKNPPTHQIILPTKLEIRRSCGNFLTPLETLPIKTK